MRIKELKLHGFKSFVDRTSIKFDDNYIGIVGPNGSGKSNIIDAIRWVFGEQSTKNMRGTSSTDIIFGGTQKRKKVNLAEVTLVLDNSDGYLNIPQSDVAITRRLYRTGGSEYLINNNQCRLKDISDLILDTGMGKSSFSIISQGQIENIIMNNPENRRTIVEEVAGVVKYKNRKISTKKKLEKTHDNLEKVNIILSEMNERIVPLKQQAENAKEFVKTKDQLKEYEITYLTKLINETNETFKGINHVLENSELELINLDKKQNDVEEQEEQLKKEISDETFKKNELDSKLLDLQKRVNEKEINYKILHERKMLSANEDDKTKRLLQIDNSLFTHMQDLKQKQKKTEELTKNKEHLSESFDKIQSLKVENQKKLQSIEEDIYQIELELARFSLPFATKKVLEKKIPGVIEAITNLFSVDLQYANAIETSIGGRINELVVENKYDAQQAIKFLREYSYGRQTFLPLNDVSNRVISSDLLVKLKSQSEFVGVAIDLISYDEKHKKAFENILGNVLVTTNIDAASKLKTEYKLTQRIVTLDGDVLNVTGTLTGGKFKKKNKFILEDSLKKLKNKAKFLQQNNYPEDNYQNFQEIKSEIEMIDSVCKRIVNEISLLENEKKTITATLNNKEATDVDFEEIKVEISQLNEIINEDIKKVNNLDKIINSYKEKLEENHYLERELSHQIKEINKKVTELSIEKAQKEGVLKSSLEILREEYSMTYENAYQNHYADVDLKEYLTKVNEYKRKLRGLGNINLLAIEEYDEIVSRYNFIDEQKKDLLIAKEKLENIINKLDIFFIETFSETFFKLRAEFQIVFSELFGGGSADLILTNPDDYLTTGVEIIAQPPGKKLQTITLLSGGEKALTAISLLFAILRIRPVPFAILDEVEAALDEVNVKRYAKYLDIFSERTQFLVITHRQGTMESVNKLYGVTMEEKGVSKVIEAKLHDGDKNVQTN